MGTLLLTRSPEKNHKLLSALPDALVARFGQVIDQPLLEARALEPDPADRRRILDLDLCDQVIFISENAVRFGLPQLQDHWPQWPVALQFFAVGPTTAAALCKGDPLIKPRVPGIASSEGLLAMPELQQPGKVLIVRGRGGRETLRETLLRRGAQVDYLEVYERLPRPVSPQLLNDLTLPVTALVYSAEALDRLLELAGDAARSFDLVVPSTRLRGKAYDLGIRSVTVAASQADEDMIATLETWSP